MPIRNFARLADGAILFVLPGWFNRPTSVEITAQGD